MHELSKVCLDQRAWQAVFSSWIFRLWSFSIHIFYFHYLFINIFTFSNPEITFSISIKGFQSSQGVWKHLFSSFHLCAHFLPFIVHLYFLNLKRQKIFLDFNLIAFLLVDSTSTCHCSNRKIRFEELSLIFWYVIGAFNDNIWPLFESEVSNEFLLSNTLWTLKLS